MPWNQQGGGQKPWGRGPSGPQPPDIEEILRRGQDRVKRFFPGKMGTPRGILLALLAVFVIWVVTGFYRVDTGEQGVELLFGKYVKMTSPGLNYWFPAPIGEVLKPNVERTNQITIGFRGQGELGPGPGEVGRGGGSRNVLQESLMLTGDQNIVDDNFLVQWRIKNAADFLFNIRDPVATIKVAAESAMREVIGQTTLEEALTTQRQQVDEKTKILLQQILDSYGAGVVIAEVKQQKVDPPAQVIDAFNDVQRAKQDRERQQNEAIAYRNDIGPKANGQAATMVQAAMAYREKVIMEAEGEAQRFLSVYTTYKVAKDVTIKRLYLETMQQVLRGSEKVIIDTGGGQGVVPYLPLPELRKRSQGADQ